MLLWSAYCLSLFVRPSASCWEYATGGGVHETEHAVLGARRLGQSSQRLTMLRCSAEMMHRVVAATATRREKCFVVARCSTRQWLVASRLNEHARSRCTRMDATNDRCEFRGWAAVRRRTSRLVYES